MAKEFLRIGVIGVSRPPATRWGTRVLRPQAVTTDVLPLEPGTLMTDIDGVQTVYLGQYSLALYVSETGHYLTNLMAVRPSVWVAMIGDSVTLVTPDPYEGEALASDSERIVEALPMPQDIREAIAAFVATHHEDEPFVKRKRNKASIESQSDPRAPRILRPEQKWGAK